jgi:pimeloyl-ACP methyl ester carboxylesterase
LAHVVIVNVDGLHVEAVGEGPTVLLVHGGAEDADLWAPVAAALAERHQVVRYDRRGASRSTRAGWPVRPGAAAADRHADDAAAIVTALGCGPVSVCGGSSGAVVALALAVRHPALCRAVLAYEPAILEETVEGREAGAAMRAAVDAAIGAHPGDWPAAYDAFLKATGRAAGLAGLASPKREIETRNAEAFCIDDLPHIARWQPSDAELAGVSRFVTVMHGTATIPALAGVARSLAARGGLACRTLDGAGHTPYSDEPERFAAVVAVWAEEGPRR